MTVFKFIDRTSSYITSTKRPHFALVKNLLCYQILLCCILTIQSANIHVCNYDMQSMKRPSPVALSVLEIDAHLCTHLMISFVKLNLSHWLDYSTKNQPSVLDNAVTLREQNPSLKVLVNVGGWNHGSHPFEEMTKVKHGPETFANSSLVFLNRHKLDGLNVDWQYPIERKYEFSYVLYTLRSAFDVNNKKSSRPLLLTAAVSAKAGEAEEMYHYEKMNRYLDFIIVTSYDFHGSWEGKLGYQSALQGDKEYLDMSSAAEFYANQTIDKSKIIMGFPTYGRAFMLQDQEEHGIGEKSLIGSTVRGVYTDESGLLAYYEICQNYLAFGAKYSWDPDAMASYLHKNFTWVSFDSKQALCHKLQWLNKNNFSGWMVWSIDLDDFNNMCSEGRYPLINFLKQASENISKYNCDDPKLLPKVKLNKEFTTAKPKPLKPSLEKRHPGGALAAQLSKFCAVRVDGVYAAPDNCYQFIQCANTLTHIKDCPFGLMFNEDKKACDWKKNVRCISDMSEVPIDRLVANTASLPSHAQSLFFLAAVACGTSVGFFYNAY